MKQKYAYRVLNEKGEYESWSGYFPTLKAAMAWHRRYGEFWKDRGHKLRLFEIKTIDNITYERKIY